MGRFVGWTSLVSRRRRWMRRLVPAGLAILLLASTPWAWTQIAARGHVYGVTDAPTADVVIVLGTEVAADGQPSARLAGRLETAAALMHAGRARAVLVSGDGDGASGDEPAAMTSYLTALGIHPERIVADPFGLDTYDTCARARQVYGITRALLVTQPFHLSRAVTLCRHLDVDVEGVPAACPDCGAILLAGKHVRDYFASGKAAWDAARRRPPAVGSPATAAIADAMRG